MIWVKVESYRKQQWEVKIVVKKRYGQMMESQLISSDCFSHMIESRTLLTVLEYMSTNQDPGLMVQVNCVI